jgi:hypothetical protein
MSSFLVPTTCTGPTWTSISRWTPSNTRKSTRMTSLRKSRKTRIGAQSPRYSFLLNPHVGQRFTHCPRCEAKTRVRKIPLVIHVDPVGAVMLRKTCRLCVVCEILVAHQAEIEHLIDSLVHAKAEKREYVVLGTLGTKTWRRGLSGSVTVQELVDHMADFKEYMRID